MINFKGGYCLILVFRLDCRPMKRFVLSSIVLIFILLSACKDEYSETTVPTEEKIEKILNHKDSVSFVVNGKTYILNSSYLRGTGNRQINLKPYLSEIPNRRWATNTGNFYFYGAADSILYDAHFGFTSKSYSRINFIFTKQYKNDQLRKDIHLLIPSDNSDLLKVGTQSFNLDYDKENTTEGIVLKVS